MESLIIFSALMSISTYCVVIMIIITSNYKQYENNQYNQFGGSKESHNILLNEDDKQTELLFKDREDIMKITECICSCISKKDSKPLDN